MWHFLGAYHKFAQLKRGGDTERCDRAGREDTIDKKSLLARLIYQIPASTSLTRHVFLTTGYYQLRSIRIFK